MDLIKVLEGIGKKKEEIIVDIAYGDLCDSKRIAWLHKADKLIQKIMKKYLENYSIAKSFGECDFINLENKTHYRKDDVKKADIGEEQCGNCMLYIKHCCGENIPRARTCPGFIKA